MNWEVLGKSICPRDFFTLRNDSRISYDRVVPLSGEVSWRAQSGLYPPRRGWLPRNGCTITAGPGNSQLEAACVFEIPSW